MSLAERIKSSPPNRINGHDCSIGVLLNTLKGAELDALVTMLGTDEYRGWSQREIYEALTEEGYTVGKQTPNRHRNGDCRCPR